MSFAAFDQDPLRALVQDAGGSGKLSLIIGAGASMEAGLPSWEELIRRLLQRAAKERGLIDVTDRDALERWEAEAVRDGYLGAAAIVDALAQERRDDWLIEALYRPHDPSSYFPGAISCQLPHLHRAFSGALRIMTMNYDDLIEEAFREDGSAEPVALATADHRHDPAGVPVYHLHGHVQRDGVVVGRLVLSEGDYQRMLGRDSWQGDLVRIALRDSTVVFVGTSLIDPNLLRYLHAVRDELRRGACYAVFVRQGTYPKDVPEGIPAAREKALCARWEALGVRPVFVDHYIDVAQVLHEIARRRAQGPDYVGLADRSRTWVETVERDIMRFGDDSTFEASQRELRRLLRKTLARAIEVVGDLEGRPIDETLACTLWLADAEGLRMTTWVTSDRVHVECETVERVRISEHSSWAAVRAFCQGTFLAEPRNVYASRWRFVRATPLVIDAEPHGRIPVGALAVSSRSAPGESRLATMAPDVLRRFTETLEQPVLTLLARPFGG